LFGGFTGTYVDMVAIYTLVTLKRVDKRSASPESLD